MSIRVSPTEKIRAEIDALFGGERELARRRYLGVARELSTVAAA